ncbi:hypothetical protein [Cellulomonas iranensis]|uniref:hypothetical protein n=1 Tax=Cellulomonas iranensis TaxID=76862 RepID=UPI001F09FF02|nr:hypothetical protein [Cellulomonas iranensis]
MAVDGDRRLPGARAPRRYGDDAAAEERRRAEERRSDELHEQMLRDWEAQLRAREQGAAGASETAGGEQGSPGPHGAARDDGAGPGRA